MSGAGDPDADRPSLMRSLGEFVGHIARAVKHDPASPDATDAASGSEPDPTRREIARRVEEERRDGVVLRRTTIEEIELPADPSAAPSSPPPVPPTSDP